jgi:hypothetical protein
MSGWRDFEPARQRREELLREGRMARTAGTPAERRQDLRRRVLGICPRYDISEE